jgi:hypothetical protein
VVCDGEKDPSLTKGGQYNRYDISIHAKIKEITITSLGELCIYNIVYCE